MHRQVPAPLDVEAIAVHLHGCTDAKSCGSIINALVVLARVGKAVSNVWHFSVA